MLLNSKLCLHVCIVKFPDLLSLFLVQRFILENKTHYAEIILVKYLFILVIFQSFKFIMNKIKTRPRDDSATDSQDDSDFDNRTPNSKLGRSSGPALKKIKIKGYDTTDALPNTLSFTLLDILGIVISICTYFADVSFDIAVALMHYWDGVNTWFFTLTVCFIAVPSLTMTGFSLRWYLVDADEKDLPAVSTKRWIIRIVFLVFQMGPVLR